MWELQRIPFLSINEICYLVLGRGDAVGAGRELPAQPSHAASFPFCSGLGAYILTYYDAARRVATSSEARENRF